MVGVSRKSTIKIICDDQLVGSLTAALLAVDGARILRVHDVKETTAALKIWESFSQECLVSVQRRKTINDLGLFQD